VSGPGFLGRGLQTLQRRWQAIAGSEYDAEAAGLRPELPADDRPRLLERMRHCLDGPGGEVLARSRAAALGRIYLHLNGEGRREFLRLLASEFDLDFDAVERALGRWRGAGEPEALREARRALLQAAESPRTRLLTRFNALPEGVKFLVDLRADLLPLAREDPLLASLDDDLKGLLSAWFDVDFLDLRRISWNTASGALLEKFMAYEAVHPVESWEDLKNRLDHDRRYFAFFHPRMPQEPLIFLEVALVRGLADNIQSLLDPSAPVEDPVRADTAIFYSISNAQRGLAGIAFGGFLIKRVVDALVREFPGVTTFATLSPLPGFRSWLEPALSGSEDLLLPSELKRLRGWTAEEDAGDWLGGVLVNCLWCEDGRLEKAVRPIFLRLAARYLTAERRWEGQALDPVAHFHLSNGARVERLNWGSDTSPRGMAQAGGIMVNYLYDARKIEENHETYRGKGEVPVSPAVRGLVKG
jgi:malonyl-CoA decarboxylase